MYLQSRNASDSSDHVVKIADHLGCLGWGVHTGCKNTRCQKIIKSSILTILRTSGNQAKDFLNISGLINCGYTIK